LLAYFGADAARPPRTVRLRVIKDGYDFASALLSATQHEGRVDGRIHFNPRGGDRHPTLDPLPAAGFECGRLFAELDFDGLPDGFHYELKADTLSLECPLLKARFTLREARFGTARPTLAATPGANGLTVTLDFQAPRHVRWDAIGPAFAAFQLELR
jgi:hypothetical protein